MSTSAVAVRDEAALRKQLKDVILKEATDAQITLAIRVCDRYGFDPLLKHVCFISGSLYVTRDGLLDNAHRSGVFDGIAVEAEQASDGYWIATATVWRTDMTRPFVYSAYQPEHYVATSQAWKKSPRAMTVKCAEVMALRRAFNISLGSAEEMGMDDEAITARVVVDQEPRAVRLPLGLRPEQWDNLCTQGREFGIEFDPMAGDEMLMNELYAKGYPAIDGTPITPRTVADGLRYLRRVKAEEGMDRAKTPVSVARPVTDEDPITEDEITQGAIAHAR